MATQLSVRNVDPKVIERLKRRAKKSGRSLSAELRLILHELSTYEVIPDIQDRAEIARRTRALFAGRHFDDSTIIIRKDRDSR
jgi:plasmid stability protein